MKRRLFQGLLIAALLCGAVLLAQPTAAWAAIVPEQPKQENGVYQIGNAGELYWFAGLVNGDTNVIGNETQQNTAACAVLTENITINKNVLNEDGGLNDTPQNEWTPIGNSSKKYTGTFDGNGKTISGLYINSDAWYAGLFGVIGTGGTVQNLTLADSYINSSVSGSSVYVGGICGLNDGSITNCHNSGTVTGNGRSVAVGGICGRNDSGSISNCRNSGSVSGTVTGNDSSVAVGGICGGISVSGSGSISDCSNSGSVSVTGNGSYVYVGGICGGNYSGSISGCSNSGSVTGNGSEVNVGGICGHSESSISISNCSNSGSVSGSGSYVYVGGICGRHILGSISISDCNNSGTVTGNGSGSKYVGGICGWSNSGSISNCYWLDTCGASAGVDGGDGTVIKVEAKNAAQFASGEVAWLLNQGQENGPWRQNLDTDNFPVLDSAQEIVYRTAFYANTGKEEDNSYQYANSGGNVSMPQTPDYRGYTFGGWYDNKDLDGEAVKAFPAVGASDEEYWAKWTANTYKVTLNTNNGTIADGKDVTGYTYGVGVTLPTDVTRAGYTFEGWYEDETCTGNKVTAIPADAIGEKTYWAKWTEATYSVTLHSNGGTIGSGDVKSYTYGTGAVLPTDVTRTGYTFAGWYEHADFSGEPVTAIIASDTGDKEYWAKWTAVPSGPSTYQIVLDSDITGGTVTASPRWAARGDTVFLTVTADEGYELSTLSVSDRNGDAVTLNNEGGGVYSFTMPIGRVTVTATFDKAVIELPFTDVAADDWFYDPVCFVYENGLMTGTSATTFEPNTPLSRAMLVAVLHRLEGSPAASGSDFNDVASGDWYAEAVNWAASVGVVNGMGDGSFQPNAAITREQMAAILRNYAAYKGMDVTTSGDLSAYSDAASVSSWAEDSVAWAVNQGLISGMTVDTLQPQGVSTRAQVAAVLQRYLAE